MNEQQYSIILAMLADKVKEQEERIGFLNWKVKDLEEKLAEAENTKAPAEPPKPLEIR